MMTNTLYAETAQEQVQRWDRGETIWTVEMGCLGPGYEQAIQVAAVEITRDYLGKDIPSRDSDEWERFIESFGEATIIRITGSLGGLTGAMEGAAKNLALQWLIKGPSKVMDEVPKNQHIQCSKAWPRASKD